MENTIQLDAIQTKNGTFLVFFHECYAAYFNAELSQFCPGEKPWREEAHKEWDWALDNWHDPEVIELTVDQSNTLIELVRQDAVNGIVKIKQLVTEEYSQYAE